MFVTPEDNNIINLLQNYLVNLEKIEGLTRDEYLLKAGNIEKEFAYTEADSDTERNKKDTAKLIYSPDRFIMPRMHHSDDKSLISDPEKLAEFVK